MSAAAIVSCRCGCGLPAPIAKITYPPRGYVKGQALPFRHGHHPRKPVARYRIDAASGCWVWYASPYGQITFRFGDTVTVESAHRYFYEKKKGPIPDGLELDHLCRNPRCVNPEHLEAVTHAENARRGAKAKVTPEIAAYIRENYSVERGDEFATRFGIARCTVTNIAAGRNWL